MRADWYYDKGHADMVLIHSRDASGKEALNIPLAVRNKKMPLVIVPTKFPHLGSHELLNAGYNMVIWANQMERVKIKAIREALKDLRTLGCAFNIEQDLSATLDDMKGLMPND